jgi:hypothetical protein
MSKQTLIYVIPVDDSGSDDYTNEDYKRIAGKAGTVYTLSEFQDEFNYNDSISVDTYIRIITE